MSKLVTLLLITVLTVSGLVMVESVFAQSVPEFTVELVDHSYVVPETYSIDPYTGEKVVNPSYIVENKTIDITIKNQPSTPGLSYNVRSKGHFEDNWTELFDYDESGGSSLPIQSPSGDTVILISKNRYPDEGRVDFQVEAVIVTRHLLYPDYPNLSWLARWTYETSGWSETQTLTIEEIPTPSPSPEPTIPTSPTPLPSEEPQLAEQVILGVAVTVAVLAIGLGLLLYLIKRK